MWSVLTREHDAGVAQQRALIVDIPLSALRLEDSRFEDLRVALHTILR